MAFKSLSYVLLTSVALFSFNVVKAHEHTHASLTRAAFRYLDNDFLKSEHNDLSALEMVIKSLT